MVVDPAVVQKAVELEAVQAEQARGLMVREFSRAVALDDQGLQRLANLRIAQAARFSVG